MACAGTIYFIALVFLVTLVVCVYSEKIPESDANNCPRFDYEYKLLERLLKSEFAQREMEATLSQLQEKLTSFETDVQRKNLEIQRLIDGYRNGVGSVYVRWGRTTCQGKDTDLVYKGYAAGSFFEHKGGAADFLCLPEDPSWGSNAGGTNLTAYIFGAEFQLYQGSNPYSTVSNQEDAPCCVCKIPRMATLMIPGRTECYPGWSMEYMGYLMSGKYDHYGVTNYVCVDAKPEAVFRGSADTNGHLLYVVQARCGSLPCPPYVEGRVVACVVCSK